MPRWNVPGLFLCALLIVSVRGISALEHTQGGRAYLPDDFFWMCVCV